MSTSVVDECDRRVSPWTKFSDLTKLQRSRDKKSASPFGSPIFCQAICLFSVIKSISTFRTPLARDQNVRQTEKYFSVASMDRENFSRFPYQNFDFQRFQGAAGVGPYMSLLTDEQKQRGSSFNYIRAPSKPDQKWRNQVKSLFPRTYFFYCRCLCSLLQRRRNSIKHWKGQTILLMF